jgi:hypothetical protein
VFQTDPCPSSLESYFYSTGWGTAFAASIFFNSSSFCFYAAVISDLTSAVAYVVYLNASVAAARSALSLATFASSLSFSFMALDRDKTVARILSATGPLRAFLTPSTHGPGFSQVIST